MVLEIDEIFDSFNENSIFRNKSLLQTNYVPLEILHRDEQIKQIASILGPVLRGERPSNLFLYGKTGTGKTLTVQYVRDALIKRSEKNSDFKLKIEYLNCKLKRVADTDYRILAAIIKELGGEIPSTGLPTGRVYSEFIDLVDKEKQLIVLILDEIDQTVKKISDDLLYNLTRLNAGDLKNSQLSIVGISNDLTFLDSIDPRVRSSLSEEEIVFPPYDGRQLHDILSKRSSEAFNDGVVEYGIISKCASLAAKEHGDARRALDLLRIAGELCEREGEKKILFKHLDAAKNKIESDKILDVLRTEPKQFQFVLYSIIFLTEQRMKRGYDDSFSADPIFTGEVYNIYQQVCLKNKQEVLSQRRVGDIIQEFDMLGIINVRVISKGRGGRMREIKLVIPRNILESAKTIIRDSIDYTL